MAMGRRKDRARTPGLWIAANELAPTGGIRSTSALRGVVVAARNWAHYFARLLDGATLLVFYLALFRFTLVSRALALLGTRPTWARSGRELYYLDATNALTAVSVHTTPTFVAGVPTKLIDGAYFSDLMDRSYDVSPDGQRFLMIMNAETGVRASTPASIVVVLNWLEELKAKVPTGK